MIRYTTCPLYDRDDDPVVPRQIGTMLIQYEVEGEQPAPGKLAAALTITDYLIPIECAHFCAPTIHTN